MFANRYYEHDIKYTFEMNRFLLRMLGMWPVASTKFPLFGTVTTIVLVTICFALLLFELVPSMLYIFMVLKDTRRRINVIGNPLFTTVAIIKYGFVVLYKNQVKDCLMAVDKDWRNVVESNDRTSMINNVKISRRLLAMCAIFVYLTGVGWRIIIPLSKGKIVTAENVTIRVLPCLAYFVVFDVQRSPAYEIIFVVQFFSGFMKYTITVAIFGFVTLCGMHICAQLNILATLMNNFVNEHHLGSTHKKLVVIVKHQVKTLQFLELVQSTTQYPSLIEILSSTLLICIVGYYILLYWGTQNTAILFTYSIAMLTFCFNIFIFCYMGEQVIEQGEKIALTLCTLEWYRLPNAQARALILIMAMSNSPVKLQGGKFIDLSLRTFGTVIKMALTYLNLLRTSQF